MRVAFLALLVSIAANFAAAEMTSGKQDTAVVMNDNATANDMNVAADTMNTDSANLNLDDSAANDWHRWGGRWGWGGG